MNIHKMALLSAAAFFTFACTPEEKPATEAANIPEEALIVSEFQVAKKCPSDTDNCFTTIQSAIDAASAKASDQWRTIKIAAGEYYEKIRVDSDHIRIEGDGRDTTRLYFDAVAETARHYHRNNWGTPGSATLTINAKDVFISGLNIENSFDYISNDKLASDDPNQISNPQAAALLLDIESDRVHFDSVGLRGYQDTIFANGARAYITNSFISGNVDFIFGNGQLLIEDSEIQSRLRGQIFPEGEVQSFILAPSTQLENRVGIVVNRSRLTREEGLPDRSVSLGRPWHPTTTFPDGRYADPNAVGHAAFFDTWMDAHIHEDRWSSMNGTARNGDKTDVFLPEDSRFMERGSTGPGAHPADIGVTWTDFPTIQDVYSIMFDGWDVTKQN